MAQDATRRMLLKTSGLALGLQALGPAFARAPANPQATPVRLSFNENPYGPSPTVAPAIERECSRLCRYADAAMADALAEQIAAHERVPVDQVILGEILGLLGLYLGSQGGPGGEFIYSVPGYLALVDAAAHVGGVGVGVPLDAQGRNDLSAMAAKINGKTRALYLVNPHNPTGTVNDDAAFKQFLRDSAQHAVVVVDEAYLEYTPDFRARSAVSLVRDGANVMVFRTFDKIHGLAGLPIGYVLAPRTLADALRKQGAGDAESLGRLNIVAAQAALRDTAQVEHTRDEVAREREQWLAVLNALHLKHTDAVASFVFFDAGRPQPEVAAALRAKNIDIGRAHPPYTNWARITVGLPGENREVQQALRQALLASGAGSA